MGRRAGPVTPPGGGEVQAVVTDGEGLSLAVRVHLRVQVMPRHIRDRDAAGRCDSGRDDGHPQCCGHRDGCPRYDCPELPHVLIPLVVVVDALRALPWSRTTLAG